MDLSLPVIFPPTITNKVFQDLDAKLHEPIKDLNWG